MNYLIAFGANLGDRVRTFESAALAIAELVGPILRSSRLYETEPLLDPVNPIQDQPRYLNAAWLVESHLDPLGVLQLLQQIERELGRDRSGAVHWAPRLIDLDLIAAEGLVIETETLTLPHPELHRREFVLQPLLDVCPEWLHPKLGQTVEQMLRMVSEGASQLDTNCPSA
jgi:2-amino-4-hydroxy-6-hydroxymethyldihydropteridine diphosphokinase